MAELTPYTPRSQMSMDLLKAISEPKMTAQDLARQEEQARVEEFGGIFKPTQDQNILEGMRKVTGWDPKSLEQTPLDRAALAAEWVAPGIKGKAMMPAFKEGMAGAIPLITRFREMLNKKTGKVEKTPLYYPGTRSPERFDLDTYIADSTRGTTHGQGAHLPRESITGSKFSMTRSPFERFEGMAIPSRQRGIMSQVEIKGKGKRLFQHDPDAPNSTMDDFEAVGHDMANVVFGERKNGRELFKEYLLEHGNPNLFGPRASTVSKKWRSSTQRPSETADDIWDDLKDFGGGFVDDPSNLIGRTTKGRLLPKDHLKKKLALSDEAIANVKQKKSYLKWSKKEGKNVPMTPEEVRVEKATTIRALKKERKELKDFWNKRYVKDFGGYLRKSKQSNETFEELATPEYFDLYQEALEKEGYSHVIYRNTNPWEVGDEIIAGQHFPAVTGRGSKDTAMVWNMGNVQESWGR